MDSSNFETILNMLRHFTDIGTIEICLKIVESDEGIYPDVKKKQKYSAKRVQNTYMPTSKISENVFLVNLAHMRTVKKKIIRIAMIQVG